MENISNMYMIDDYSFNPTNISNPFNFIRFPPGISPPIFRNQSNSLKEKMVNNVNSLSPKLEDFKQLYHKYASGLFEINSQEIIPPTHPLYSRKVSIETLQSEKSKLKKENIELKKQLDLLSKQKRNSN